MKLTNSADGHKLLQTRLLHGTHLRQVQVSLVHLSLVSLGTTSHASHQFAHSSTTSRVPVPIILATALLFKPEVLMVLPLECMVNSNPIATTVLVSEMTNPETE